MLVGILEGYRYEWLADARMDRTPPCIFLIEDSLSLINKKFWGRPSLIAAKMSKPPALRMVGDAKSYLHNFGNNLFYKLAAK
jgi:hypothetical protein